ncbi:MAG: K(+)-transporting ATPase subunit F [Bryobacterales bacterium]|nr:K(+)-transporting ATPase subunit F [Bryobacterales bacterium]
MDHASAGAAALLVFAFVLHAIRRESMNYALAGMAALALFAYLLYALLMPERF